MSGEPERLVSSPGRQIVAYFAADARGAPEDDALQDGTPQEGMRLNDPAVREELP